jgi:hypothetical protein
MMTLEISFEVAMLSDGLTLVGENWQALLELIPNVPLPGVCGSCMELY